MRLTAAERQAAQLLQEWNRNVPKFVHDNFQINLEPWTRRATAAYSKPGKRRVGLSAAVGVGKSAWKAMMCWHFLSTNGDQIRHRGKYPNGYALSINRDNLKSGLWKELGVWYERSPFLQREFLYTAEQIVHRQHAGWWLRARSYRQSADPETQGAALSGLHSPWALVALDEIGEMHPVMGRRAEQILSDAECEVGVILASGNPTSTAGLLYDISSDGRGWEIVNVSGDPDDPERSSRVDLEWAKRQIKLYGRDNPWVMSHVLGKFPPGGLNTLLGPDEVRAAMHNRNPRKEDFIWAQKRLGIDVARFGDDRTVIFPRQGLLAIRPIIMRGVRTDAIVSRALLAVTKWGSEAEFVDGSGHWGHGVVDGLLAARRSVREVFFEHPAAAPQYFNRRSEMWFGMREWVLRGGSLPNIPEMVPELTRVRYGYQKGKIILEPKDEIKKNLGFSPDLADALALTFAEPDMPSAASLEAQGVTGAQQMQDTYDPHAEFRHLRLR